MEDGSHVPIVGLLILLVLFWVVGIFYGFAAAVRNLSESEIMKKALEGNEKAKILSEMLEKPLPFVNAIPLMVITSGIWTGVFLVPWLGDLFQRYLNVFPVLILAVVMFICVILYASLGILTFRRLGTYAPEKFAFRYVRLVNFFVKLLYPCTMISTWLARLVSLPFGVPMDEMKDAVTEEEIISIVDEAHEQGVIEENEAEMIQNIISFNETDAQEIMTHRKDVLAFDQEILLQEMVEQMMEEGKSRYPVYGEDLDDILGIIHYKDVMKFYTKNSWARFKPFKELPGLLRPAAFVPETRSIGDLFRVMQAKKQFMAVVVDEYGQTSGIVSMEDILEEIVGDILDEYDEDTITFHTQVDNSVLINGMAHLEDVEEELGISFGDVQFETLNGYLTCLLGHIPTEKDLDRELTALGYRFKILSLGNRTIGKVRAEKIDENKTEGEDVCQDIQNFRT